MKLSVIIPTLGRDALVGRAIEVLLRQKRKPDEIIISAPNGTEHQVCNSSHPTVRYVFGKRGLTAQRNRGLEAVFPHDGIITFFDDDFLACSDYLERLEEAYLAHPDWAVVTGSVFHDGVSNAGLTFDEGLAVLEEAEHKCRRNDARECAAGYGCNMSIRGAYLGGLRFDERLPLYGWQEDVDFTRQMRCQGRVVQLFSLVGVHLGYKAGRVSGIRFGYSQIANPVYLIRKGTMPRVRGLSLMARNVAANTIRSLWPEPYFDRRGRLKGNILGIAHQFQGRLEPERILQL